MRSVLRCLPAFTLDFAGEADAAGPAEAWDVAAAGTEVLRRYAMLDAPRRPSAIGMVGLCGLARGIDVVPPLCDTGERR
jgi:hypothetical protein